MSFDTTAVVLSLFFRISTGYLAGKPAIFLRFYARDTDSSVFRFYLLYESVKKM